MFKILSPLGSGFNIEELISLGAEEFYFGVDFTIGLNKRDNPHAQVSLQEAKDFLKLKKRYFNNIKFFIVLNEAPVDLIEQKIYDLVEQLITYLSPDAFIVRDFYLMSILKQIDQNIKIHLSSLSQIWNKSALDYFVDFLGDSLERIIFPRDITGLEIYKIVQKYPHLEFEIFAMNEWCWNIDGLCSSLHYNGRKIGIPFVCYREHFYNWPKEMRQLILNRTSCKVCGLWRFRDVENVVSLKIVGRGASYEQIKRNVVFLKKVIDFMELVNNELEYKKFCKISLQKVNKVDWCKHCEFNI